MEQEYEYEGFTYKLTKLGLSDAKECLAKLSSMGFFDRGLDALISAPKDLDEIQRRLFHQHCQLLNEQGDWVPLGKDITERHFSGRLPAYFNLIIKAIGFQFEDFLGGGWTTGLAKEQTAE